MLYHRRLINHFSHINTWVNQNDARSTLDMGTFQVTITAYDRTHIFFPQFLLEHDRTLAYSPVFSPNVNGFIGWLPYPVKQWPSSTNKLLFKRHVEKYGKRTPQYWLSPEESPEHVLIKPAVGSFGGGQRGPWRTIDLADESQKVKSPEEFYERFRTGTILKAWYWNDKPICIELRAPLTVRGNGSSTVWELVRSTHPTGEKSMELFKQRKKLLEPLLAYQFTAWEKIPETNQVIQIDYLYGSSLYPDLPGNENKIEILRNSKIGVEIENCGKIFWSSIPAETRHNTAYAVDGIIGDDEEIRWLEINSNPMFPPDAYSTILDSLFKV